MMLLNKNAIVTGASRGIGLAISKELIKQGVQVAGWSRTPPEDFTDQRFRHIRADLASEESVEKAWKQTVEQFGSEISILINNAGVGYHGLMEETPGDRWRHLFDVNVHGIFYVSKRVIPGMKKQKEGHIINIGSGAGTNGIAGMSAYCGTKYAVAGITESMHTELRDFGVKVTCLSPGSVETDFSDSEKNKLLPAELAASVIHMLTCSQNFHYTDVQVRPLQP